MCVEIIEDDGIKLKLEVVPLSFTKPHEETIDELVGRVARSMVNEGVQIDPVIIDGESGTVLDGMHRRAAAKMLGLDKLLVCKVDYRKDAILLKRWVRVSKRSTALLEDLKVNLELVKLDGIREAIRLVDRGDYTISLLTIYGSYVFPERRRAVFSAFYHVRLFDSLCSFHGITNWPARDVDAEGEVEKDRFVLYVPKPTKEEVVEAASVGPIFPPKYTRHIIPARPVGVAFPLKWLKREVPLSVANEKLKRHVKGLKIKRLPPKSVYMGRMYDEVLYVFGGRP